MKITEALQKAAIKRETVSSERLDMFEQDLDSIGYWLVADDGSDNKSKIKKLKAILEAKDWKVDND